MTRVIKSADAGGGGRVQALHLGDRARQAPGHIIDPEMARLRALLENAAARIGDLEAEVDDLKAEIPRAAAEAEARGREAGLAAAEDRQADRLAAIEKGVAVAVDDLVAKLASLERLAPLLAREGLERLVRDPAHRSDLLRDSVLAGVQSVDADAVVRVELASEDFPEIGPIAAAISGGVHRPVDVRQAIDLRPGQCRIRLVLGEIEVGLNQKWDRLARVLDELATPEAGT